MAGQKQRVALVTGAARGIGFEIAKRLVAGGALVYLVDILVEVNDAAAKLRSDGGAAEAVVADVGKEDMINAFAAEIIGRHGAVDILVNNAGISPKKADGQKALTEFVSLAEWDLVMRINLGSAFMLCKAVIPAMRARKWGRIINMSSRGGRAPSPITGTAYSASKAGLIGFSRTLALEVAADGITVNCIAPGRIETPMAAVAGAAFNQGLIAGIPVGRLGVPADIAAAAVFLASEETSFITGHTIDVNGGVSML